MNKISLHQKNKQISGSKRKAWLLPALKAHFVLTQLFPWKVSSIGLGWGLLTAASVMKKIATSLVVKDR